jgi:dienelactone hydrolase
VFHTTIMAAALLGLCALAMAEVKVEPLTYQAGGATLKGVIAYDDAVQGKRPGIVVFPEWWGLTDYPQRRARQLAEAGYVALAADVYGDGKTTNDPKQAGEWADGLYKAPQVMVERAQAALAVLSKDAHVDSSRLAATGYCMGGTVALHLARSGADLKAVVAFHAGLANRAPSLAGPIKARLLVCNGADDKFITQKEYDGFADEMRAAKADWELVLYGGAVHAFSNPDADKHKDMGIAYNEPADRRSWKLMLEWLAEAFATSGN